MRLSVQIHNSLSTDRIGYQFASSPLEPLAYVSMATVMLSTTTTRKEAVATHVEAMDHKYTIIEYMFVITYSEVFATFELDVSSLVLLVILLPLLGGPMSCCVAGRPRTERVLSRRGERLIITPLLSGAAQIGDPSVKGTPEASGQASLRECSSLGETHDRLMTYSIYFQGRALSPKKNIFRTPNSHANTRTLFYFVLATSITPRIETIP